MKKILVALMLSALSIASFAKDDCTTEPKEKWMKEDDFKKKVAEMGYTIKKFKTPGSCYEIYGKDKDGKKVEIYFNPVNAEIVKQK